MQRVPQAELDKAFLLAVKACSLEGAKLLNKHGANVNARDERGDTALHYACAWPDPQYEAVKWLIQKRADVNASNNDGMTPDTGHTPLSEAAATYDNILAIALIRAGADVNALTPDGAPLHIACRSGHGHTESTFKRYGGNILTTLLAHGADPNLQEQYEGKTPLHMAADFDHPTPLVEERYLAVVHSLLTAGADPSVRDKKGKTAHDYAVERKHHLLTVALEMKPAPLDNRSGKTKSLAEKAADAPISFLMMVDVIQTLLEREHPQVMLLPHWSSFHMLATVGGCTALALRLHFEVAESQRTHLEMTMREILLKRFPVAESAWVDSHRFMTECLGEIPRSERGKAVFPLIALWVVRVVSEGKPVQDEELIAGKLTQLYQNETAGFWKSI